MEFNCSMKKDAKIRFDRAGGTSDSSGNPPANITFPDSYHHIIDELEALGFADADAVAVPYLLERVNYQHLKPYLHSVKSYMGSDASVKAAHDLLTFDRRFQSIIFKYIGIFELQFRAQYAHWLKTYYGDFALYDADLFLRYANYQRSIERYEDEVKRRKDKSTREQLADNSGRLPIAYGIELVTLGTLSKLYSNTKDQDLTTRIASFFGASKNELSNWAKTVAAVRNICAHFEPYVVRKGIPSSPLPIRDIDYSNRETFYVAILLSKLLSSKLLFGDLNLSYSYRLYIDIYNIIREAAAANTDLIAISRIPDNWEDLLIEASGGVFRIKPDIDMGDDFVFVPYIRNREQQQ